MGGVGVSGRHGAQSLVSLEGLVPQDQIKVSKSHHPVPRPQFGVHCVTELFSQVWEPWFITIFFKPEWNKLEWNILTFLSLFAKIPVRIPLVGLYGTLLGITLPSGKMRNNLTVKCLQAKPSKSKLLCIYSSSALHFKSINNSNRYFPALNYKWLQFQS